MVIPSFIRVCVVSSEPTTETKKHQKHDGNFLGRDRRLHRWPAGPMGPILGRGTVRRKTPESTRRARFVIHKTQNARRADSRSASAAVSAERYMGRAVESGRDIWKKITDRNPKIGDRRRRARRHQAPQK